MGVQKKSLWELEIIFLERLRIFILSGRNTCDKVKLVFPSLSLRRIACVCGKNEFTLKKEKKNSVFRWKIILKS